MNNLRLLRQASTRSLPNLVISIPWPVGIVGKAWQGDASWLVQAFANW